LAELEARLFAKAEGRPRLSRYHLQQMLGAGAMAVVYAAHDPELDRPVAVKLEQWQAACPEMERQQLLVEAQLLARISHPHVVSVYDVGQYSPEDLPDNVHQDIASEGFYVVMERVYGVDLGEWLIRERPSLSRILEVFTAAGRGLSYAHSQGVVHRDFKPSNVLIGDDGTVKVVDFGLALSIRSRMMAEATREDIAGLDDVTTAVVGTPAYMAPEQQLGRLVDHRADQFSFCASLAEALYGQRVFQGRSFDDLLSAKTSRHRVLRQPVRIPRYLRRAIDRGLHPDPAKRFTSMGALLEAIAPRRRTKATWAIAIPAVLAVGAAGAWIALTPAAETGTECTEDGAEALAEAWDGSRRKVLTAAFVEASPGRGSEIARRTAKGLDDYAARWAEAQVQTCRDAPEDKDERDLRLSCLEQQRVSLEALVGAFVDADAAAVGNALRAVAELDAPAECAEIDVDGTAHDPRRKAFDKAMARARALQLAVRYSEALAQAELAQREAEAMEDPALVAEAKVRRGYILDRTARPEDADALLEEAYFEADRAGAPLVAARAATLMVSSFSGVSQQLERAKTWARHARAQLTRNGGDRDTEEVLEGNLGIAYAMAQRHSEALQHFQRALQMRELETPDGDWRTAAYLDNIGLVHLATDNLDAAEAAHRKAYELLVRDFGPDDKKVALVLNNLGQVTRRRGDADAARRHSEEALALVTGGADRYPHVEVASRVNLGQALIDLGRTEEALAHLEEALALLDGIVPATHPTVFDVRAITAEAYHAAGRLDDARAEAQSLIEDMAAAGRQDDSTAKMATETLEAVTADLKPTAD